MSTQQIILIIIVVVVVGIAFSTGIIAYQKMSLDSHRQSIMHQMTIYVTEAIAYRKLPGSLGGGNGSFVGYYPANAVDSDHVSGNSPGGVKVETTEVNYFIEWYFNDRLKIIASSKLYGEGHYWPNTYNARITAIFDKDGNVDEDGFVITGDW